MLHVSYCDISDTGDLAIADLQLCDHFQPSIKCSEKEQPGQDSYMVEKYPPMTNGTELPAYT
jgi:hypothetical protein